jgi:ATP-dependent Clp protease protease subunit
MKQKQAPKPNIPSNDEHGHHEILQPKYLATYVELADDRLIFLTEDITKQTAGEMIALLLHYDSVDPKEHIVLYINTRGGDGAAMFAIYDCMKMIRAPITTVCAGKAYSAGAFLLMAGDYRVAFTRSEIMLHGLQVIFPVPGREHAMDSKGYGKFISTYNDRAMKIVSACTGKTVDQVKKDCASDMYLSANEAKTYGLIDEVIG